MLLDEALERALDDRGRDLVRGELGIERDVAESTRDDPPVEPLVPVVEPVPAVVRDLEEQLLDRLGRDHLAARRDDEPLELTEQAARVAVRRDDDGVGAPTSSSDVDTRVLADLDARGGGAAREAAHEPCRLQHAVRRMEERRRIASGRGAARASRHSAAKPAPT